MERFLIAGEWRESQRHRPVVNPFTCEPVYEVYQAGPEDIDRAIRMADDGFRQHPPLASFERAAILRKIAEGLRTGKERFARLITRETGKPISYARTEAERAVFTFETASEEAKRMEGTVLPLDMASSSIGRQAIVSRFPLGPIGAITPFNFPLNLVAHKLAPAFAVGCPVVLKPSSNAPVTALELARLALEAGLPEYCLSVVPCASDEADQLITDERIKLVTFTGSPAVGWPLKSHAGKKRVVLELGGNAAVVIHKDADIADAVSRIIGGAFGNAGQSCISTQRLFVHEAVYDRVLSDLLEHVRKIPTGDPADEKTVVGPMITEEAAKKVESWLNEATKAGAHILSGGGRKGAMLEPTLLADVAPDLKVSCQEVFAPVLLLERYSGIDEVLQRVNRSAYGLQAGLFTNDAAFIFRAYRELEVGGVIVNDSSAYRMDHMPYGGVKDSGFGREGIRYAMEEMTELRLLALRFP